MLPQKQLLNWYDEVDTACESSSHNDDGEFDSDADCDPFASSSTDREQCNLLTEEIDKIGLANTAMTNLTMEVQLKILTRIR